MTLRENPEIDEIIAGALHWWRDAGVDCAFLDEPVQWQKTEEPAPQASEPPPQARPKVVAAPIEEPETMVRLDRSMLPVSLDDFEKWWLGEPQLAEGSPAARVPPRGPREAELMVIVPEPEADDRDTLLSGPQGRLLDAMLAAFGIAPERTYFASAVPRHLPGADWDELAAQGMGHVLAHHITLVQPKRLAVFGANVLPLIDNGPPQGAADLRIFNHEGMNVQLLACRSLAALLEQPRWKARIWQVWTESRGTDPSG